MFSDDYIFSPDQLKLEGEESSKTKNSQRMRAKNIYTAPEIPSNTNLHTIYELKKRLAKTPKCQSLKYKSEVFIVSCITLKNLHDLLSE